MEWEIKSGDLRIEFDENSGGMPQRVFVREADGNILELFGENACRLEVELSDGRILRPCASPESVRQYRRDDAECIDFQQMHFRDASGLEAKEFHLSMLHEFHEDGTAFTQAFFFIQDIHAPAVRRFEIAAAPELSRFDELRWAALSRPKQVDGTLVTAPSKRFMEHGKTLDVDANIIPSVGFYGRRSEGPSLYCEFFMEGCNTLSANADDNESSVAWENGNPRIRWNFQKKAFDYPCIQQWRNQWGWVIRPARKTRRKPPMRMYHYYDNFARYPSREQIRAILDSHCDILILHENWRLDTQNGGVPFDPAAFVSLRDAVHAHGIRLAVYTRGVEDSLLERQADWFPGELQYNFDGLYMDYGSVLGISSSPNEIYNGGRIHFHRQYLKMKALRERVGADGLLFSHCGPSYSAVGMNFTDGYVSGEGERGMMVRGRPEHEYFSMAAVGPGTMWTAAFPEYSSPRMIPFLAAAGQYPHCNLGTQFPSSSLAHPGVPGVDDRNFVPLWKLWATFRNERNITIFCDFNSRNVFPVDANTGHYLMISEDGNRALLILSNFRKTAYRATPAVNLADLPKTAMRILRNGAAEETGRLPDGIELPPFGVAGIFFASGQADADSAVRNYLAPEAPLSAPGEAYRKETARQAELRICREKWDRTYLFVEVDEMSPTPYEDSMTLDLFNNVHELGTWDEKDGFSHLAYIDRDGTAEEARQERIIFAGCSSPAIELNRLLPKGKHTLALYTTHLGSPFYSFCNAVLSPSPDRNDPRARKICFYNELEPDRAYLHFTVELD